MQDIGEMSDAIVHIVSERDFTLFSHLMEEVKEMTEQPVEGESDIAAIADPNVILWSGVSVEFAAGMCKALDEEKVHLIPVSVDLYREIGDGLRLPEAIKFPKSGYKTPHWFVAGIGVGKDPEEVEEAEDE